MSVSYNDFDYAGILLFDLGENTYEVLTYFNWKRWPCLEDIPHHTGFEVHLDYSFFAIHCITSNEPYDPGDVEETLNRMADIDEDFDTSIIHMILDYPAKDNFLTIYNKRDYDYIMDDE